jgi:hypothetical protein
VAILAAAGSFGRTLAALGSLALICATPAPDLTIAHVLTQMAANTRGLQTYQVPISIDVRVNDGLGQPLHVHGMRFFKAPDQDALRMDWVPAYAKPFQHLFGSLGTPTTWPSTYDISLVGTTTYADRRLCELRGTYKQTSTVDYILLDVDLQTFDPVRVRWFFKSGATIVLNISQEAVGTYRLPRRESLDVAFPQYHATADVTYGRYVFNKPLPAATFTS